jgi:acyl transferase domain-containing protein
VIQGPLDRVDIVQPALFAVMVSLAELWRGDGIEPSVVLGHSQGEVASAVVAGALSLADGARVAALRGKALRKLAGLGGMLSVSLSLEQAETFLRPWDGQLVVAAVNGPASVVVSGGTEALDDLARCAERDGVTVRRIAVGYASHSPHVDQVRDELLAALAPIRPGPALIPFVSAVTGAPFDTTGLDAGYWFRNLREPVRFEQATRALLAEGHTLLVECGPHPVLLPALQDTIGTAPVAAIGTLRRGTSEHQEYLDALGRAHAHGATPDWPKVFAAAPVRMVDLPTYAFQHRVFWPAPIQDAQAASALTLPEDAAPVHSYAEEIAALAPEAAERRLRELVRGELADALGQDGDAADDPNQPFAARGVDSLVALDIRGRLSAATGLALQTSVVFDHPTPLELARHLLAELRPPSEPANAAAAILADLDRLEADLAGLAEEVDSGAIRARLRALQAQLGGADLLTASAEELLDAVSAEFEKPGEAR